MRVCRSSPDAGTATPSTALLLLGGLLAVALAPLTEAKVKITTRADGRKVIYDEPQLSYGGAGVLLAPGSHISGLIDHYARDRGLSPALVQAVIQVESAYDPNAVSSKGAMGLMQLMPDTARLLRVRNPYDPDQNIRGGTLYLRRQLDRFSGDLTLALAAYNAGPAAVTQYGGVPPYRETRNYVRKVLGLYRGSAPALLQDHARDEAKQRTEVARRAASQPRAARIQMSRGKNNRIFFTNAPRTH